MIREISHVSVKPSPRKSRNNFVGDFELVLSYAIETDPSSRALILHGEPSLVHNPNGNVLVFARVLFQSEDKVEIEDVS